MRNVIVTGGSRGLGLAVARQLAGEGHRVVAIARTMNEELASAREHAEPGSLDFIEFDLEATADIPALVRHLHREFGPFHGLVNNAGLAADGSLAMMRVSEIERLIRLNTLSPILFTKSVVRHMMADGGGRIVNIASIVAATGYAGLSVYAATKSAMVGFTKSLAREVGRLGITVNAVAPGFMDTEMTRDMSPERKEQIVRRSALRRFVCPQDVAGAVVYLLGDSARNITGTVLTVDAGATA